MRDFTISALSILFAAGLWVAATSSNITLAVTAIICVGASAGMLGLLGWPK